MYRQSAREVIVFSFPALDKGGDDAEVAIAEVEDERGGSIGRLRTGDVAGSIKGLKTIIAGTRFSSDLISLPFDSLKTPLSRRAVPSSTTSAMALLMARATSGTSTRSTVSAVRSSQFRRECRGQNE